jgi:hypothetical protein
MSEKRGKQGKVLIVMITVVLLLVIISTGVLGVIECSDSSDCPDSCWDCVDHNPNDYVNTCCEYLCGDYGNCTFDTSSSNPLTLDDEGCYNTNFFNYECCDGDDLQTYSITNLPNPTNPYYDWSSSTRKGKCCSLGSTPYSSLTRTYTYMSKHDGLPKESPVETIGSCCDEPTNIPAPEYAETSTGCWKNKKEDVPWNYIVGGENYVILTSTKKEKCYECYEEIIPYSGRVTYFSQTCQDNIPEATRGCCADKGCYDDVGVDCCSNEIAGTADSVRDESSRNEFCGNSWLCSGGTAACGYKYVWEDNILGGQWNCDISITNKYQDNRVEEKTCKECSGEMDYLFINGAWKMADRDCALLPGTGFSNPQCCYGKCYDADIDHCSNNFQPEGSGSQPEVVAWCEKKICEGVKGADVWDGEYEQHYDSDGNGAYDSCCEKFDPSKQEAKTPGTGRNKHLVVTETEWKPELAYDENPCALVKGLKEGEFEKTCAECNDDTDCSRIYGDTKYKCCHGERGDNICYDATKTSCCAQDPSDPRCNEEKYPYWEFGVYSGCMILGEDCCGDPCVSCDEGNTAFCDTAGHYKDPLLVYEDVINTYDLTSNIAPKNLRTLLFDNYQFPRTDIGELRTCWINLEKLIPMQKIEFKSQISETKLVAVPPQDEETSCGGNKCPCDIDIPVLSQIFNVIDDLKLVFIPYPTGFGINYKKTIDNTDGSCGPLKSISITAGVGTTWKKVHEPDEGYKKKEGVEPHIIDDPPEDPPIIIDDPPDIIVRHTPSGSFHIDLQGDFEEVVTSAGIVTTSCTAGTSPVVSLAACEIDSSGEICDIGCSGANIRQVLGGLLEFDAFWWLKGHELPTGVFGWSLSPDDGLGLSVGTKVQISKDHNVIFPWPLTTPITPDYWAMVLLANLPLIDAAITHVIQDIPFVFDCYDGAKYIIGGVVEGVGCFVSGIGKFLCNLFGGSCGCTGVPCLSPGPGPGP